MLSIIFVAALIWVAFKMLIWGIKAAWGIAKVLAFVVLLPLFVCGLAFMGLVYIAVPLLVIVGLVVLIGGRAAA